MLDENVVALDFVEHFLYDNKDYSLCEHDFDTPITKLSCIL